MRKILFTLAVLLPMSLASFAQTQLSPNPAEPDFLQGGHTAPFLGSAGQLDPCALDTYEAIIPSQASDSFLLMRLGPCGWGTNQNGRYTTGNAIKIQQVSCWIGTSSNSRFETVSNLQIWAFNFVSQKYVMVADFLCEFDKHTDVKGNLDEKWTFAAPLSIPSGAIITTYRYPGGLIFCGADYTKIEPPSSANGTPGNPSGADPSAATWNSCATEIHWRLYGTGN